ncbi:hypothetical protein DMH01_33325 [Amycolatopsis sp. WAC 04182]|nr:hypothetical protein DMH01_33325 [Amycolatopsis sp. WAC 04182]
MLAEPDLGQFVIVKNRARKRLSMSAPSTGAAGNGISVTRSTNAPASHGSASKQIRTAKRSSHVRPGRSMRITSW